MTMTALHADIDLTDDFICEEYPSVPPPISRIRLSAVPGRDYDRVAIGVWMKRGDENSHAILPEQPDFLFFAEKRRIYELRNALSAMIAALQE